MQLFQRVNHMNLCSVIAWSLRVELPLLCVVNDASPDPWKVYREQTAGYIAIDAELSSLVASHRPSSGCNFNDEI